MVGKRMGHDQQALLIGGDLNVVVLINALIGAVLHDARIGVGEVVLILVAWAWLQAVGFASPRASLGLAGLLFSLPQLGFILGLFSFVALFGPLFQNRFGLGQIGQPLFSDGDLILR